MYQKAKLFDEIMTKQELSTNIAYSPSLWAVPNRLENKLFDEDFKNFAGVYDFDNCDK